MDLSFPLLYCTQANWSFSSSNSELHNTSSPEATSLPPCVGFSPNRLPFPVPTVPRSASLREAESTSSPSSCEDSGSSRARQRRSRTRTLTKQRQSASEKEKLRMRDLTKALHHLRTYLPPSVAPAGQTLTKIETLRLAIRYISYLSSQLGAPEETHYHRKELRAPGTRSAISCHSTAPESWRGPGLPGGVQCPYSRKTDALTGRRDLELPACNQLLTSSLEPLLELPLYPDTVLMYQDNSKDVHYENPSADVWT